MHHDFKYRVTQTQKLIAEKAIEAIWEPNFSTKTSKERLIDIVARSVVTIQAAGMGAYYHRGTQWSWRSRNRREPQQVAAEQMALNHTVDCFNFGLDHARGKAACRIRENRARRERQLEAELREQPRDLQEDHFLH